MRSVPAVGRVARACRHGRSSGQPWDGYQLVVVSVLVLATVVVTPRWGAASRRRERRPIDGDAQTVSLDNELERLSEVIPGLRVERAVQCVLCVSLDERRELGSLSGWFTCQ